MRDKKQGNRILIYGIAFSICLCVLAGSAVLYLSETFIRNGIADMAGAVGTAAPEQLGDVMHLYKAGDGLRDAGAEILGQYGYGRDVYSFVPAWFGATAYAVPFCIILAMLLSFGLYRRAKVREAEKRTAALSGYLDRIMEGQYDTLMQDSADSALEDSIYKAVVLLREEREQAQEAKKNLADNMADLSHQLKTLAASIGLTLSLLKKKAWDGQTRDDIRRMEGQVSHLQQLVGSMLTLSKLDAGVLTLEEKEFGLEEMLVDAVQPFVLQMEEKGICFGIQGADGISLAGDFGWCSEAFGNIIKNCMEHTPEQGNISIACQDNPLYTEVIIQDSGGGFDEADLPHLFERFYRGAGSSKDSAGIGLALSKSIIEKENGTVTAENAETGGARFRIKFYHCHRIST
ncbi:MAG: HAMP domain-containing histidine kinase [Roseburia sp.]|nr:HAMP domain-containing histidine kinase [Roseburia sp.]MCM1202046.1 HAMP domain-containing histidine kinase [Bacteroides fragilis]